MPCGAAKKQQFSLEGCCSTVELHPRIQLSLSKIASPVCRDENPKRLKRLEDFRIKPFHQDWRFVSISRNRPDHARKDRLGFSADSAIGVLRR
jgi:hypothetical protein